jgi:hypothetical protein
LDELERLLALLITEQRKLHTLLCRQRDAMKVLRSDVMEEVMREQESVRGRLAAIETRRKVVALQAARELRIALQPNQEPTLTQLITAAPDPARKARLTALRDQLRTTLHEVAAASHIAGRLAGAVLGHLNTAMRVLQSAMRDAGTYTRTGTPKMGPRLGAVEVVG